MRIIFEFAGGPWDGKTVSDERGEQGEAERYFMLTHHGRIGQRFTVASEYGVETLADELLSRGATHHIHRHTYVVSDRIESPEEVLVRAEYWRE